MLINESIDYLNEEYNRAYDFPEDCIRFDELCETYFPGISKNKVRKWLADHPRGVHAHQIGRRIISTHPYKKMGLKEAADRLRKERLITRETEKCIHYFHKEIGIFKVNKKLKFEVI